MIEELLFFFFLIRHTLFDRNLKARILSASPIVSLMQHFKCIFFFFPLLLPWILNLFLLHFIWFFYSIVISRKSYLRRHTNTNGWKGQRHGGKCHKNLKKKKSKNCENNTDVDEARQRPWGMYAHEELAYMLIFPFCATGITNLRSTRGRNKKKQQMNDTDGLCLQK